MTFFQQDLTKPFPDELLGTFDLIDQPGFCAVCADITRMGNSITKSAQLAE
jgi:hypothetical protein